MISVEDRLLSFETPGTERCTARRTHRRTDRCTGRRTESCTDPSGVPTVAAAAPVHRPVQRQVRRPVHYLAQDRRRGAYTGHLMPRLRRARKKTKPRRARMNTACQTPTERKRVPESAETCALQTTQARFLGFYIGSSQLSLLRLCWNSWTSTVPIWSSTVPIWSSGWGVRGKFARAYANLRPALCSQKIFFTTRKLGTKAS